MMDTAERNRLFALIRKTALIFLIGGGYYGFIRLTGLAIPCLFRLMTHKYCPGCGVTGMIVALLHLDIPTAFRSNALLMILLPFLLIWAIYKSVCYVKTGSETQTKHETAVLLVIVLVSIAFAVLRNTDAFSFLQPQNR